MSLEGVLEEKHLGPDSLRLVVGPCIETVSIYHQSMAIDYSKFSCAF